MSTLIGRPYTSGSSLSSAQDISDASMHNIRRQLSPTNQTAWAPFSLGALVKIIRKTLECIAGGWGSWLVFRVLLSCLRWHSIQLRLVTRILWFLVGWPWKSERLCVKLLCSNEGLWRAWCSAVWCWTMFAKLESGKFRNMMGAGANDQRTLAERPGELRNRGVQWTGYELVQVGQSGRLW